MTTEQRLRTYVNITEDVSHIWYLAAQAANRPLGRQLEVIIREWDAARRPASATATGLSPGETGTLAGEAHA